MSIHAAIHVARTKDGKAQTRPGGLLIIPPALFVAGNWNVPPIFPASCVMSRMRWRCHDANFLCAMNLLLRRQRVMTWMRVRLQHCRVARKRSPGKKARLQYTPPLYTHYIRIT